MSCSLSQLPPGSSSEGTAATWTRIKVSKELASAIQDDARRKAIDAAKKRAVSQHVDYETFQAMVSVAHLKPVERDEWYRKPAELSSSPAWNFAANGSLNSQGSDLNPSVGSSATKPQLTVSNMMPKNAEDFQKQWRKLSSSPEDQLKFLRSISPEKLGSLFKVETRPALLGEIFAVLNNCWESIEVASTTEAPSPSTSSSWKAIETGDLVGAVGSLKLGSAKSKSLAGGHTDAEDRERVERLEQEAATNSRAAVEDTGHNERGSLQSDGSKAVEGDCALSGKAGTGFGSSSNRPSSQARDSPADTERTPCGSGLKAAAEVRSLQSALPPVSDWNGRRDVHQDERVGEIRNRICELLAILAVLAKSGRFSLTLRLLSAGHKKEMRSFFEKLRVATAEHGEADELARLNHIVLQFCL